MECNRDEAIKAKELAEKKFSTKDLIGAKRFAVKAQNLFPDLDGLPQLLATLDVHISSERRINGEVDWYGVLGVDPSSDDDTIRKQYRKLALILHPDKNKSVGAEGAFKILSESWSLLSDKEKRAAYDNKRRHKGMNSKGTSASVNKSGFNPSTNNGSANMNSQKSTDHPPSDMHPPSQSRSDTFWTACTRCRMQYEYLRVYLNQKLLCPNCQEPFVAIQMPPPQMSGNAQWPPYVRQQTSNHSRPSNSQFVPGVGQGGKSASLEDMMKSRMNSFKRPYASDANSSKNERPRKRVNSFEHKSNDNGLFFPELERFFPGCKLSNILGEPSLLEVRYVLMDKASKSIFQRLKQWKKAATVPGSSIKADAGKRKDVKKYAVDYPSSAAVNGFSRNASNGAIKDVPKPEIPGNSLPQDHLEASHCDTFVESNTKSSEPSPGAMSVPDPDFHDFDNDRSEHSFGDNQVWAAYDDDDGMPRYYALIHSVVSRKPFKMRISWLNSKSNAEFGPLEWVSSGFYKTCGEFRIGKHEMNKSINSFSHRVHWAKGPRGTVQIYPRKGGVWALYRNWSADWNVHTSDEVIHQYDMVVVLEDYNSEKGTIVVPLIKVAGYKTVFREATDSQQVRIIPKEEMFRFSHQVPSCLLTGKESPDALKGCWELDPAATPLELLRVTTETEEQGATESSGEAVKPETSNPEEPNQTDGFSDK